MTIKVILVDDHVVVRQALKSSLDKERDLEVVGEAGDGREGVRMAREIKPNVVVMDIAMPNLNGVEATRQIVAENPDVRVLALSMHSDRLLVAEMLKAGAAGYLVKQCTFSEMVEAIRAVASGNTYLSPTVTGPVVEGFLGRRPRTDSPAFTLLSPREREVLQLMAEGLGTRQIADQLNISVSTVETHRRQLKTKLQIDNYAGLIKFAISEGLTTLD
jgi:DNA-binding NarL/FixJ family response regulator